MTRTRLAGVCGGHTACLLLLILTVCPITALQSQAADSVQRSASAAIVTLDGPPLARGRAPSPTSDSTARRLRAARVAAPPLIDGRLSEAEWSRAPVTGAWRQVVPDQGVLSQAETDVRVLQDDRFLYVGVLARRLSGSTARPRNRNLQRDFFYPEHDAVAIMFDPFKDGRGSWIFGVAASGNIEDRAYIAGVGADSDWDVPWRARTTIGDSGWSAEIAIPWSVIPTPPDDSTWAFNALRTERSINESSMWSPVPRGSVALRSDFFGRLDGVRPQRSGMGLQMQPYLLRRIPRTSEGSSRSALEAGGEIKWRPARGLVADLTVNTDFAQADVDRQVVNLTRFSVLFPERRPFFQESRLLFSSGIDDRIQPVFTRRIGLDESGRAIPIVLGARVLQRSANGQAGVLVVRQGNDGQYASTDFGVARVSRNLGRRARMGAMLATRRDIRSGTTSDTSSASREHATAAIDGFVQLTPFLSVDAGASHTWLAKDGAASAANSADGSGLAAHLRAQHLGPVFGSIATVEGAQDGYRPLVGFLARSNYLRASWGGEWDVRPQARPAWLRRLLPGYEAAAVWGATSRSLEEARVRATPLVLEWQNGARVRVGAETERQVLRRPFSPLPGVRVLPGITDAWRAVLSSNTDPSRSLALRVDLMRGGYFNGHGTTVSAQLAWTPDPRVALTLRQTTAVLRRVGDTMDTASMRNRTTHLLAPELRLAWSPRLQLTTFHQFNTSAKLLHTNVRLSWELQPLSFVHVVWNDERRVARAADPMASAPRGEFSVKMTYLLTR